MAEFPALPIFTDALIADTQHLTEEELGAYLKLLMLTWRNAGCKLPADAAWHMRRLGTESSKYKTLYEPLIAEFFQTDGNYIFQKRLLKEFIYLRTQSSKQSARAKSRWNKNKSVCRGNATSGNAPHPTPPKDSDTKVSSSDSDITLIKMPFTEIPPEWKSEAMRERGWTENIVLDVWSVFRDHWHTGKGKNTKREDWSATWRNWYRKENIKSNTSKQFVKPQEVRAGAVTL